MARKERYVPLLTQVQRRERRAAIADYLNSSGETVGEVALRFKVSVVTVKQACNEHGIPLPRNGRHSIGAVVKIVRVLMTSDLTLNQIASLLDVSYERVRQVYEECVNEGIAVKARRRQKREDK